MMRGALILIAGLAVAGAACAKSANDEVEPANGPSATVEVRNDHPVPVEIFAVGSGSNQRLGTVHPGMQGRFSVPPSMLGGGSVELQVRAATGQVFRSGALLLAPGAVVDVAVATQLFNSTATVRP
jgi:hypothetical protein